MIEFSTKLEIENNQNQSSLKTNIDSALLIPLVDILTCSLRLEGKKTFFCLKWSNYDFFCYWMVVTGIYIPMVSSVLIGNIAWEVKGMIRISLTGEHILAVDICETTIR